MPNEKTTVEKQVEKEVTKGQVEKSRFGILFTIRDVEKGSLIEIITFGAANLNEFQTLADSGTKQFKKIIEDTINKQIDDSCPTCDRTQRYRLAG